MTQLKNQFTLTVADHQYPVFREYNNGWGSKPKIWYSNEEYSARNTRVDNIYITHDGHMMKLLAIINDQYLYGIRCESAENFDTADVNYNRTCFRKGTGQTVPSVFDLDFNLLIIGAMLPSTYDETNHLELHFPHPGRRGRISCTMAVLPNYYTQFICSEYEAEKYRLFDMNMVATDVQGTLYVGGYPTEFMNTWVALFTDGTTLYLYLILDTVSYLGSRADAEYLGSRGRTVYFDDATSLDLPIDYCSSCNAANIAYRQTEAPFVCPICGSN